MLHKDLIGLVLLIAYYVLVAGVLPLLVKAYLRVPSEVVRKLHHVAYAMSIFLLLNLFSAWYMAVLGALMLVLVAYPGLLFMERFTFFKRAVVEREGGELRRQLVVVQLTMSALVFVFWGLLGTGWQYIAVVAVMAWGFGDAAAALVGKACGRRRILHRWIEGTKTLEGTVSMYVVVGFAVFFTLLLYAGQPWYVGLPVALLVAPVSATVELFSHRGMDTLTVPLSTAFSTFVLMALFPFLGV